MISRKVGVQRRASFASGSKKHGRSEEQNKVKEGGKQGGSPGKQGGGKRKEKREREREREELNKFHLDPNETGPE